MEQPTDTYITLSEDAETIYKEKGSKFLCYAFHVENEEQIKEHLDGLRKQYYDATHHCYAWRLGPRGESFRANDDGEPSSTAGKPILGQLLSKEVTDALVVVVRYFGGTKLGVSGLITAYKESAARVLDEALLEERTVNGVVELSFDYLAMNDVMRVIKEMEPAIVHQEFDNTCRMTLSIRMSLWEILLKKLSKIEGVRLEEEE